MKIREVIEVLEAWAPPGLAYDWDRSGFSLGDPDADVQTVLVALTVTEDARKRAAAAKAQLIVSHHPLIWQPLKTLRMDDPQVRLCRGLLEDNIACYAAHTNLDVAPRGVSHILATQLGLQDCAPLFAGEQAEQVKLVTFVPEAHLEAVRGAVCTAGAGIIGDYTFCSYSSPGQGTFVPGDAADPFLGQKGALNVEDERRLEVLVLRARIERVVAALRRAHPYEEPAYDVVPLLTTDSTAGLGARGVLEAPMTLEAFAQVVLDTLALTHLRVVGAAHRTIRSVAVMGGAGGSSVRRVPRDVDAFVTGDVGYHDALEAATRGLAVIDAGHSGTEKGVVDALAGYLKRHCAQLTTETYIEPDVFRALVGK
jgi:dinuclear metal center YbgI/SA1388 family protein